MTLRAVAFDWGGTLAIHADVELRDLWRAAATELHDDPAAVERLTDALVEVERAAWAETTTTMRSSRLMDLLREASHRLDLDVAEAVLHVAQEAHLDAWTPSIAHRPSAPDVLRALRQRGLVIGLLSNTHWPRAYHEHFLERDGLVELIDVRVYTCEHDWVKPHPDAFAEVLTSLGTTAAETVFVGDRPIDDIQGAKEVGMRAVWVRNGHAPGDPSAADAVIDDLDELPDLLAAWGLPG